jgi:hypothetical protein
MVQLFKERHQQSTSILLTDNSDGLDRITYAAQQYDRVIHGTAFYKEQICDPKMTGLPSIISERTC